MRMTTKSVYLIAILCTGVVESAQAQVTPAVQVPLETASGWGAIKAPAGFKALRVQGRSTTDPLVLARLFADFASHPALFPRVVEGVDILACDASSLRARYRTMFDSKPGGKTMVESLTTVKVSVAEDRIEFTWSSDAVSSSYVNAAAGRALFVTRRTSTGTETLIDYVSTVRPKNAAKGLLVETQKPVLANDAKYVIDRLMAAAKRQPSNAAAANIFNCSRI